MLTLLNPLAFGSACSAKLFDQNPALCLCGVKSILATVSLSGESDGERLGRINVGTHRGDIGTEIE